MKNINDAQGQIFPEEYLIVKNSIQKRKKEFIAGRTLAKLALESYGIENYPLLSGKNREPLWPDGIIGSISHTNTFACTVVTKNTTFSSVGIDIETLEHIHKNELELILTKFELDWISTIRSELQNIIHKIIFSVKESFYKCAFPIINRYIDFKQVDVIVKHEENIIEINNLSQIPEIKLQHIKCNYFIFNDHVLTYVTYK